MTNELNKIIIVTELQRHLLKLMSYSTNPKHTYMDMNQVLSVSMYANNLMCFKHHNNVIAQSKFIQIEIVLSSHYSWLEVLLYSIYYCQIMVIAYLLFVKHSILIILKDNPP